jgi:hypothetical protein
VKEWERSIERTLELCRDFASGKQFVFTFNDLLSLNEAGVVLYILHYLHPRTGCNLVEDRRKLTI